VVNGGGYRGLNDVYHLDGDEWVAVHADDGREARLGGIAGRSVSDICAVGTWSGETGIRHPLVLHFDGVSWTEIPNDLEGELEDVWPYDSGYIAVGGGDTLVTITQR
jgi:hypothetical protein